MRKPLFFKLLCVFSFVFGLFSVSTGLSDYIIDKATYDENGTLSNQATSANDNGEKVTVSFKTLIYEKNDSAGENVPGYADVNIGGGSDHSKLDALKNFFSNNVVDTGLNFDKLGVKTYGPYNGKGDYFNCSFNLIVLQKIEVTGVFNKKYNGKYTIQIRKHDSFVANDSILQTLMCSRGTTIDSLNVNELFSNKMNGYYFLGVRESKEGNLLDGKTILNENKTLYACFIKQGDMSTANRSFLTETINSATGTLECWKGNSDKAKDIATDPSYNQTDNKVYLGTSSLKTTVKAGATIRFNMNNGKENQSLDMNGANVNIEPEDGKHELQYIVALANDLIVNGAFTIGGHFGTNTNAGTESHLVKEYVCLDLNGHDIYVESSGELWSYGLIKDSVGTGHIYINGGTLKTLATVMDYRGGDCTSNAVSDNVFPFASYALPYLRATTILNYTESGWGKLLAICHITPSSYSADAKFEIQFVGPSSGDYLFKINKDKGTIGKSKLIIQPFNLNTSGETDNMCVLRKLKLTMIDMELSMSSISLSISSYKVNTVNYNFPVNPFFDVELKSSKMYFAQKMQFSTGMSFIADENSTVIFDTNKDRSAQLSVLDRPYNYWDNKSNSFVDNDNIGQMTYSVPLHNNKRFWKLNSVPKIKIYGKLLFRTNNGTTDVKLYKLIGPIDFNERKIGYIDASGKETVFSSTTDLNPFSFLKNNNVHIQTYGFDYMLGYYHSKKILTGETYKNYQAKGFARPLRSNGVAYVVDEQRVDVGTYDSEKGIYQSNNSGKTYYFNCDGSYALGDNGNCTFKECTVNGNYILDGSEKYIYFASMYGKYNESTSKVDMSRIMGDLYVTNGEQMVSVKYDSMSDRWLRG